MTITEMHHVTAGMLSQKPHLGPKLGHPPLSARERAAARWFSREKPPISTTAASGEVFPGQYYDQETGLQYNYFRDYDPSLGRYVESDPIGLDSEHLSTYAYSDNNPVIFFDALGLYPYANDFSVFDKFFDPSTPEISTFNSLVDNPEEVRKKCEDKVKCTLRCGLEVTDQAIFTIAAQYFIEIGVIRYVKTPGKILKIIKIAGNLSNIKSVYNSLNCLTDCPK